MAEAWMAGYHFSFALLLLHKQQKRTMGENTTIQEGDGSFAWHFNLEVYRYMDSWKQTSPLGDTTQSFVFLAIVSPI